MRGLHDCRDVAADARCDVSLNTGLPLQNAAHLRRAAIDDQLSCPSLPAMTLDSGDHTKFIG